MCWSVWRESQQGGQEKKKESTVLAGGVLFKKAKGGLRRGTYPS